MIPPSRTITADPATSPAASTCRSPAWWTWPATPGSSPRTSCAQRFADAGALDSERVITYCGGGIAASQTAYLLTLLGQENVALYDGSMTEWAADPSLPLVTGAAP